jgi:hypothetical protein
MILNFEDFVNEEYTLSKIDSISSDKSEIIFKKNINNELEEIKKLLSNSSSPHTNPLLDIIKNYQLGHLNEFNVFKRHLNNYVLEIEKEGSEIPSEIKNKITSLFQKSPQSIADKFKQFLRNKHHSDSDLGKAGDVNSPYLYHYTLGSLLLGILEKDTIYAYGSYSDNCEKCDTIGTIEDFDYDGEEEYDFDKTYDIITCPECNGDGEIFKPNPFASSQEYVGACFSSDADLYKKGFNLGDGKTDLDCSIRIKLDFNKIKADGYKYFSGDDENMDTSEAENEIRIQGHLRNVTKYIVSVDLYPNKESYILTDEELLSELKKRGIRYRIKA